MDEVEGDRAGEDDEDHHGKKEDGGEAGPDSAEEEETGGEEPHDDAEDEEEERCRVVGTMLEYKTVDRMNEGGVMGTDTVGGEVKGGE